MTRRKPRLYHVTLATETNYTFAVKAMSPEEARKYWHHGECVDIREYDRIPMCVVDAVNGKSC